jgi:probable HAF family extracellular repeat protein
MKLKALFSVAGVSLFTMAAMPAQLAAQGGIATPEHSVGPHHYNLTDLGVVGPTPGQPIHITNNGFISGGAANDNTEHATLWYKRWKLDIGVPGLGGANSTAFGVNQWAQAVGEADTHRPDPNGEDFCGFAFLGFPSGTTCLPFMWQRGVMRPLPTLKDRNGQHGNNGAANQINSHGEVAGLSENTMPDSTCPAYDPSKGQSQKLQQKPVIWRNGRVYELLTIGSDPDGVALAINENGLMAGTSGDCSPFSPATYLNIQPVHAVLWENGRANDLGSLGGVSGGIALGINNRGDVVGGSDVKGDTTSHGFLWTKERGKMQGLVPFGEDVFSTAIAVNDSRDATGVSIDSTGNLRAVVWLHESPHDLNTLVPSTSGLYLLLACGVNDSGQIIGLAVDSNGVFHGYLATPRGDRDDHDAALDGPMKLSDNVREMVRKQLHFDHIAPDSTKTAP